MVRALMGKVQNISKDNINREMEILRKNKKEMLGIKNTARKMKNEGLFSRLDMAEEKL